MRTPVSFFVAFFLSGWLVGAAHAQDEAASRTTRQLAACLHAQDQPICLLQFTTGADSWRDLRSSSELRGASREIFDAIYGENAGASGDDPHVAPDPPRRGSGEKDQGAPPPTLEDLDYINRRVEKDFAYLEWQERAIEDAVQAAIEADAAGEPADAALSAITSLALGVRSRPLILFWLTQVEPIPSMSGPEMRIRALEGVLAHFHGDRAEDDAGSSPSSGTSEALARAALAAWEREWPNAVDAAERAGVVFSLDAAELASAYDRLGDQEGVERALALTDTPQDIEHRALIAFRAGHLEELATLLERTPYAGELERGAIVSNAIEMAMEADRVDIALRIALATQDVRYPMWLRLETMALIREHGDRRDLLALTESLDVAARAEPGDPVAYNASTVERPRAALMAVENWMALGMRERAASLVQLWTDRFRVESWTSLQCDRGSDFATNCEAHTIYLMLQRMGALDGAFDEFDLEPLVMVEFDWRAGRDVQRIEDWLSHAESADEQQRALWYCIARTRDRSSASSAVCARRLVDIAADSPVEAEAQAWDEAWDHSNPLYLDPPPEGPFAAAFGALLVSAYAACDDEFNEGVQSLDYGVMDEMFVASLSIFAAAPERPWPPRFDNQLIRLAAGQLRAQGRL